MTPRDEEIIKGLPDLGASLGYSHFLTCLRKRFALLNMLNYIRFSPPCKSKPPVKRVVWS